LGLFVEQLESNRRTLSASASASWGWLWGVCVMASEVPTTRLVILIKNIYALWDRKRFLLPVTYFPTNLVYPFTLLVTGITRNNAIVDGLGY